MKEAKKLAATEKFCGVPKLKVFLLALSFAYLAKTMSGGYMNSMLTQIERRFNISASLVGIINGSFETGNLLVIVFVSYIGAKLHRPRIIALGCTVMSFACLLIALPHFLMERYQYETSLLLEENSSSMCLINQSQSPTHMEKQSAECEQKSGSLMWVLVLVGNIIRGIGESPIVPLGISYVEDFSKAENSPFYIGCLQTATVLGPFLGLMLGSYCAQLYVDLGFADIAEVTITLTDARWVGAWWLGILICGSVNLLAAIPFYFLPKSLPKEGQTNDTQLLSKRNASVLEERGEVQDKHKMNEITKDFIPYLRSLFYNPVYMLFICITVLQFSAFIGMITFMPKYVEQQYGKSASQAIFLIGVYNLPVICIGYFLGGYLMKKFKINTNQAANIAFWISLIEYLIFFAAYFTVCDNSPVAGLTVSYEGKEQVSYMEKTLLSDCNSDCDCSIKVWDPVCGQNGITYVSPCLAGCKASDGKYTVFENCTCIAASGFSSGNVSAVLGQCDKDANCDMMLHYFLILTIVCSFIFSLGAIPGYMVLIRSLKPEEKSFGVGIHVLASRIFAGIPSPIYFGALIDTTCLKWGSLSCGGKGACRMYDIVTYRWLYLGLQAILRGVSYIPCVLILLHLKKQLKSSQEKTLKSVPMAMEDIEEQND
nr:solute carrier organic anion transporter family member 1A2 [Pelodiscus sinensis]XP_025039525.1 solute carrier organic anion transporter family member 1A2 [Pelodiscus sinensis]XP_025039526.1 solute carrier organic anion transporter family member 1A2 [Pelodiscus sinensis]XP_025039527.1 solute carrier organic anion transporter family member 1A2 [Pelodiscus sinensis]|eukprot:XP_025039524.1 solute carrier organic anion transporter family member 1A2 [Pelodiscus sinensis]